MDDLELLDYLKELIEAGGKIPLEFAMSIIVRTDDGGVNEIVGDALEEMSQRLDGYDGMTVVGIRPDFERMIRYVKGTSEILLSKIPN